MRAFAVASSFALSRCAAATARREFDDSVKWVRSHDDDRHAYEATEASQRLHFVAFHFADLWGPQIR
jgi:hypothetical protein